MPSEERVGFLQVSAVHKIARIALLLVITGAVVAFFLFDLKQYASLNFVKEQQDAFRRYYDENRVLLPFLFGVSYVVITALSLPLAAGFTILSGILFGFPVGVVVASFSSTLGATLAFLIARFIARNYVQKRYGRYLSKLNTGFEKEGAFYLFAIRLVPVFPFFVVNVLTAVLPIRLWTFYWVSQLGMFAGTAVYVYAGTQLGKIESTSDIVSPRVLLAFALLGVFPLAVKKIMAVVSKRKSYEKI